MKKKNIFYLLGTILTLTLSSCDLSTDSSGGISESLSNSSGGISESLSNSYSFRFARYEIQNTVLETRSDVKTYVKTSGSIKDFNQGEFKWAWRIENEEEDIIYGETLNFVNLPFDKENETFVAELCLTDINELVTGTYRIYGGAFEDRFETPLEITATENNLLDYKQEYSVNNNKVSIETLDAEFVVSEASIVKDPLNKSGLFLKMGGAQANAPTLEELNRHNTCGAFQEMSPYKMLIIDDAFWSIENSKVYYYMSVDGMELNGNYLTRFDLEWNATGSRVHSKVVPIRTFLTDNIYTFKECGVEYEIHFNRKFSSSIPGEDDFYGGLGIKCRRPTEQFTISEAFIVKNPISHSGFYLKLGGKQAYEYTIQTLTNWNTAAAFQQVTPYRWDNVDDLYWSIENSNVYLYLSVKTMTGGCDYFTHLDIDSPTPTIKQPKLCLPAVSFLNNNVYTFSEDHIEYEIHYQVRKSIVDIGEDDYYGALAIKCRAA